MVLIKLSHVTCFLSFLQFSRCHRRIQGAEVDHDKVYAVYLVKALPNPNTDWLCGGAIVTEWYIVTSAACVHNFTNMYAIAGYKKFVNANDLENDECTKRKKKKIIFSCVPKSYEFEYQRIEKWTHIDIAVVKVESKYDFKDKTYLQYCSYIPGRIDINYEGKYQQPGADAIALGWGHTQRFIFKNTNNTNYNQNHLVYAPFLIVPKSECKNSYNHYENKVNIDKYMICAQGVGNIDAMGDIINKDKPKVVGCVTEEQKLRGLRGTSCEVVDNVDPYDDVYLSDNNTARRDLSETDISAEEIPYDEYVSKESQMLSLTTKKVYKMWKSMEKSTGKISVKKSLKNKSHNTNDESGGNKKSNDKTNNINSDHINKAELRMKNYTNLKNRKEFFNSSIVGICQNDHGGPLVTWVGAREILIGVITTFIVSKESLCKGPYMFTSTQCNSAFLDCVINYETKDNARRRLCDSPQEIGFEMKQRYISWTDYPSGIARSEIIEGRQQISIQEYHFGNPEE